MHCDHRCTFIISHQCRVAGEGRSIVPAPWPRWTACLYTPRRDNEKFWRSSICSSDVKADAIRPSCGATDRGVYLTSEAWWGGTSSASRAMWQCAAICQWVTCCPESCRCKMQHTIIIYIFCWQCDFVLGEDKRTTFNDINWNDTQFMNIN